MKSDNKIGNLLRNADVLAACGALVLLVGVTFFGVIMRYCLGDPFVWQEEVQLALIIWVVFLGGRYAFVCGNHAAIDVIVEMFPEKLQKILESYALNGWRLHSVFTNEVGRNSGGSFTSFQGDSINAAPYLFLNGVSRCKN